MIKSDVSDCNVNVSLLCWGFSDCIIALRDVGGPGAHRGMMELQYAMCIRVFCLWFWPEVCSADFILTEKISVGKEIHHEMQQEI